MAVCMRKDCHSESKVILTIALCGLRFSYVTQTEKTSKYREMLVLQGIYYFLKENFKKCRTSHGFFNSRAILGIVTV